MRAKFFSVGANPNQTVDMVRALKPLVAIRGNHDKVCSGIEEGELFNRMALEAALWTRRKLTRSNLQWLKKLPQGPTLVDDAFAICHGTPIDEATTRAIGEIYERCAVRPPWQSGDLVLLDNMLVAHGRDPFSGPRKIVVAMGEMTTQSACEGGAA